MRPILPESASAPLSPVASAVNGSSDGGESDFGKVLSQEMTVRDEGIAPPPDVHGEQAGRALPMLPVSEAHTRLPESKLSRHPRGAADRSLILKDAASVPEEMLALLAASLPGATTAPAVSGSAAGGPLRPATSASRTSQPFTAEPAFATARATLEANRTQPALPAADVAPATAATNFNVDRTTGGERAGTGAAPAAGSVAIADYAEAGTAISKAATGPLSTHSAPGVARAEVPSDQQIVSLPPVLPAGARETNKSDPVASAAPDMTGAALTPAGKVSTSVGERARTGAVGSQLATSSSSTDALAGSSEVRPGLWADIPMQLSRAMERKMPHPKTAESVPDQQDVTASGPERARAAAIRQQAAASFSDATVVDAGSMAGPALLADIPLHAPGAIENGLSHQKTAELAQRPQELLPSLVARAAPEQEQLQPEGATVQPVSAQPSPFQQILAATATGSAGTPAEAVGVPFGAPEWNQALAQKVVWMVTEAQQTASLTLNPPELGPLQIVLEVSESSASASFVSAHPEVRQALEAAMPKLREMLDQAGIQLGQATVSDSPGDRPNTRQPSRNSAAADPREQAGTIAEVSVRPVPGGPGRVDTYA